MLSITSSVQREHGHAGPAEASPYRPPATVYRLHDPHRATPPAPGGQLLQVLPATAAARRSWAIEGLTVEALELRGPERVDLRMHSACNTLVVYEQGARSEGETRVGDTAVSALRSFERKLAFVPAGAAFHDWMLPRSATRLLFIHIDPLAAPSRPAAAVEAGVRAPRLFFEDAALMATAMKLKRLAENPVADNQLYFAALGVVLTHEIDRLGRAETVRQPVSRGGLAPWQQRAVSTYIEEHLSEPVPLADLAAVARLSPFYFCRAFKQSFGLPPHHYHTRRRIERAKTLLGDRDLSVTEIGLSLGFSESSSFATAFRKATGISPSRFRRSLE